MAITIAKISGGFLSLDVKFEGGAGPQARILRRRLGPGDTVDASAAPVYATPEEVNANEDIRALVASGDITVTLSADPLAPSTMGAGDQFNKLRNDVARAMQDASTAFYHKVFPTAQSLETNADASDLPTALVLVNSLKARTNVHYVSAGDLGAHITASGQLNVEPDADDLATAQTLANEIKASYNIHIAEGTIHITDDGTNDVTSANATDQASLETLLDEIKLDYNAHVAAATTMNSLPVGTY